jgi:hypothetical protein
LRRACRPTGGMPRSRATPLLALLSLLVLAPATARADRVAGTPYVLSTPHGAVFASALKDAKIALRTIDAYERRHFGVVVTEPTDVRLLPGTRCGDGIPAPEGNVGGVAVNHLICVYTEAPALTDAGVGRRLVVAHEAVHVLQTELGCTHRGTEAPVWFLEGMADLVATRALIPAGWTEAKLDAHLEDAARLEGLSPGGLRPREASRTGLDYWEAARAVAELDRGNGRRDVSFCRAVGRGTTWPAAFAATYGESVNRFYTRFARIRARLAT